MKPTKLAIIGAGKMGETLIRASIEHGGMDASQITATARSKQRCEFISENYGVACGTDNSSAVKGADMIILCIKPQLCDKVMKEIAPAVTSGQILVSIMAGISCEHIERQLTGINPVVRAMPNTPCLIGKGMTVVCPGSHAGDDHAESVCALFEPMGKTMLLAEHHFDSVTSLSASGPAFVYIMIEALAEGGVKTGLPREAATELAAQACLGAAEMVLKTKEHPAVLKDGVTTPAGCTIDGIMKMEEGGIRVTLIKAVVEAARRSGELGY